MNAAEAAVSNADAVSNVGSHFMLDGETYKRGAELGFAGLDFYVTGRGGVLGDVDADVVSAAFTFFEPGNVRTLWDQGRAVMPPAQAAAEFAACCHSWAESHVPADLDAGRLGDLAGAVVTAARPAGAPVFAGWRALPEPASAKARAVHHLNALRELRLGLHSAAVLASGLSPHQAVSIKSPGMAPLFGWGDLADATNLQASWDDAEARTSAAMAHAYTELSDDERATLVELADALQAACRG